MPYTTLADPFNPRVYVSNWGANTISVVDTTIRTVVATVTVGLSNTVGTATSHPSADRSTLMQTAPLPRGALRISDLGFFTLGVFAAMTAQGVYWFSRLAPGTAVYTQDGVRWDVLDLLAAQGAAPVDLAVTFGVDHRLPARLLAVRVPEEVANQRRRRLRAEATRRGRAPRAA